MMNKVEHKPTQNQRILDYIKEFGSITQLEALQDLGVMRLASRISDLRRLGYNITSKIEPVKNRYGEKCHIKRYSFSTQDKNPVCVSCGQNPREESSLLCFDCERKV